MVRVGREDTHRREFVPFDIWELRLRFIRDSGGGFAGDLDGALRRKPQHIAGFDRCSTSSRHVSSRIDDATPVKIDEPTQGTECDVGHAVRVRRRRGAVTEIWSPRGESNS